MRAVPCGVAEVTGWKRLFEPSVWQCPRSRRPDISNSWPHSRAVNYVARLLSSDIFFVSDCSVRVRGAAIVQVFKYCACCVDSGFHFKFVLFVRQCETLQPLSCLAPARELFDCSFFVMNILVPLGAFSEALRH